jgi:hypothetical protein
MDSVAGVGKSPPLTAPDVGDPPKERTTAMTYGHSTRAFIEDGPVEQVAKADALRSTARSWRALDEAHRIELIDTALKAANDRIDAYPLAL